MSDFYTAKDIKNAIAIASKTLSARKDEVNRLNVFPVPDGDTGTNMSLTLEMVVENISNLPQNASATELRKAVTNGALMGARGNSGVITSQILRGLCEGLENASALDTQELDNAFARAEVVAFQAVRKPVAGTILTVVKDTAAAVKYARRKKFTTDEALDYMVSEAYASVQRTPELLPVLAENGVVDAGGYGLAIIFDAFASALLGRENQMIEELSFGRDAEPKVEIELIEDWEDSKYRYCTEFLVYSEELDSEDGLNFLSTMGDCELLVGQIPHFKVHVHTNTPDLVLAYMLERGQIAEVHIHNMQLQSEERAAHLADEKQAEEKEHKALGVVAVAPGPGNVKILKSLGADVVVSGGQTMNPSTKDLLDAVESINADAVIILPNNKNIIMAAQSAAELASCLCGVVPTRSVPQAFSALTEIDPEDSLEENIERMTDVCAEVQTGEITRAIKDSKDAHGNAIKDGDIIGIADGSIEAVGSELKEVTLNLLHAMEAEDADIVTLLAGAELSDVSFEEIQQAIEEEFEDIDIDAHRGDQPLYPLVFSVE